MTIILQKRSEAISHAEEASKERPSGVMGVAALGGIPVVPREDGGLVGIEAVIDKDRGSALLARELDADMLLLLTDVDAVYIDFATPEARPIARAGADVLSGGQFAAGSMRPKIEAATRFASQSGRRAAIGRLEDAAAMLDGTAGMLIEAGTLEVQYRD